MAPLALAATECGEIAGLRTLCYSEQAAISRRPSPACESRLLRRIIRSSIGISAGEAVREARSRGSAAQIAIVGCASDGQAGPQQAPTGKSKAVAIPAGVGQRLAYYKAEYGAGVLAPRGWHCFSTYGSNGSNLFVTPDPIDPKALFSDSWKGFSGQAIEVSVSSGGTSGRFEVAKIIARVFPEYKAFAENVIAEGIEPASSFPFGPYPKDKLTYRSKSIVEFETPANTQGLGTDLKASSQCECNRWSRDPFRSGYRPGSAYRRGFRKKIAILCKRLLGKSRKSQPVRSLNKTRYAYGGEGK